MTTSALRNRVGPYVVGEDFFDREHELPTLVRLLEQGDHVSLVAQRRIGKTSLLRQAERELAERFTCLYVDLQASKDPGDAVTSLALAARPNLALWERVRGVFANVLGGVESMGGDALQIRLRDGLVGDWAAKGDRLLACLAESQKPVVLMFDELPVLLVRILRGEGGQLKAEGRAEADRFLSWLRRGALAHTGRVRVVVTGSIGLEPVARQVGLSGALNIYTPLALGPWSPEVAQAALEALARSRGIFLEEGARLEVTERLGSCIPYHVQLFFSQLEEDARRRGTLHVSREDVQRVYRARLLSNHGHAELAHMEERLRLMVPASALPLTLDLLSEAAVTGSLSSAAALTLARDDLSHGEDPQTLLRDLFGVLEHDGYLERGEDGLRRFVSRLLRDWWRARFGEFYVPAAQRGAA